MPEKTAEEWAKEMDSTVAWLAAIGADAFAETSRTLATFLRSQAAEIERLRGPVAPSDPTPLSDLYFNCRIRGVLARMNIKTVEELCALTEDDLLNQRNFGITALHTVNAELATIGKSLREKRPRRQAHQVTAPPCPHVVQSGESRYCDLAESSVRERDEEIKALREQLAMWQQINPNLDMAAVVASYKGNPADRTNRDPGDEA